MRSRGKYEPKRDARFVTGAMSCLVLFAATVVQAQSTDAAEEVPVIQEEGGADAERGERWDWIQGELELRLNFEHQNSGSNFEIDQFFRFEIDSPKHERLKIRGSLWTIEDLDGKEPSTSSLRGIDDSFDSPIQARLLYLYLEADDVWGDSTLRIGRQRIHESVAYNRVDGVYFKQRRERWQWYAFGGARASLYEDAHEDIVAGAGISYRPWKKTRVAIDYFYAQDEQRGSETVSRRMRAQSLGRTFLRSVRRHIDSQSLTITATQLLGLRHQLYGRYVFHDDDSDEIRVSATGVFSFHDITYDVSYLRRLNVLRDRTNDLTGFFRVLGEQDEFDDFQATVSIPIKERFAVSFEGQFHISEGDSVLSGNRDFQRYALVFSAEELWSDIDMMAALERWNVEDGEGSWAVTGEVSKQWTRLKGTVGVDFERYEDRLTPYTAEHQGTFAFFTSLFPLLAPLLRPLLIASDVNAVQLHENIYSLYGRVQYKIDAHRELGAQLTLEDDDSSSSPYLRLQANYRIRF